MSPFISNLNRTDLVDINLFEGDLLNECSSLQVQEIKTAFIVARTLVGNDSSLMLYGGKVRNLLLGEETSEPDYDFIGNFDPDWLQSKVPELVVGRWDEVSTIRLKVGNDTFDFTWADNIQERLSIGDINISNLCMTPEGLVVDYFDGIESLKKREIRVLSPDDKFVQDPVRILRVVRFAAELGFNIEEETIEAILRNKEKLLEKSNDSEEDLVQILTLEKDKKSRAISLIEQMGIDKVIPLQEFNCKTVQAFKLEKILKSNVTIEYIARIFDAPTLLIGGAIRDEIWGKKVNDYDFKIRLPIEQVVGILTREGFVQREDHKTQPGEFYISVFPGVVGVNIHGVDVHISETSTSNLDELISQGDLNFNCCAYDIHRKKILNPDLIPIIANKELKFANPSRAKTEPSIILNALKQISKLPDITIPQETEKVIMSSIDLVSDFIRSNPKLDYLVCYLNGNLNANNAVHFFNPYLKSVVEKFPLVREKLEVNTKGYVSKTIQELTIEEIQKISRLAKASYGKSFEPSKLFNEETNSIIMHLDGENLLSFATVSGERLYTVAARNGLEWARIISEAVRNNYNVWGTINESNFKIIALCRIGGLKIEKEIGIVREILISNTKKYQNICIDNSSGIPVFWKEGDKEGYRQVLVRS